MADFLEGVYYLYNFDWHCSIWRVRRQPQINNLLGAPQPNLEGKEVRIGWAETALRAVAATGTMCGTVNGMHDYLMPPGGFATLFNLFLQIVWGGQGTGTAYLFIYSILSVFLTGLIVARTP